MGAKVLKADSALHDVGQLKSPPSQSPFKLQLLEAAIYSAQCGQQQADQECLTPSKIVAPAFKDHHHLTTLEFQAALSAARRYFLREEH